jgi:hypothetical protein
MVVIKRRHSHPLVRGYVDVVGSFSADTQQSEAVRAGDRALCHSAEGGSNGFAISQKLSGKFYFRGPTSSWYSFRF